MTDENEKLNEEILKDYIFWTHTDMIEIPKMLNKARQQGIEIGRKTAFGNLVTNVEEVEQAAYERGKKAGWKEAMNGITQVQEVYKAELKKAIEDERERLIGELEKWLDVSCPCGCGGTIERLDYPATEFLRKKLKSLRKEKGEIP